MLGMTQFLLVYRRSTGELVEFEELGPDRAGALRRRAECEKRQKDDPDVMQTHARYFKGMRRLAGDLRDRSPG